MGPTETKTEELLFQSRYQVGKEKGINSSAKVIYLIMEPQEEVSRQAQPCAQVCVCVHVCVRTLPVYMGVGVPHSSSSFA